MERIRKMGRPWRKVQSVGALKQYGAEPGDFGSGSGARGETKRPRNAFRTWTRAEDAQVCEELRKGMDFRDIAKAHDRTIPSIVARLVKMGHIAPQAARQGSPPRRA
jgi:hypothetical protein